MTDIDLRALVQLVDVSQTQAIAHALHLVRRQFMDNRQGLRELLEFLDRHLDEHGLSCLSLYGDGEQHPGNLARPRKYEIAAALNRHLTIKFRIHPTA